MRLAGTAALIMWLATAAPAQEGEGRDCRDDRGIDRCAAEEQRRVRELFGVKAIEAHRDAGDQVRRAFYVDGYGRDLIAIAFVRPRAGDPELWVHFPREAGDKRADALRAPVPEEVWDKIIARSDHFDRELVPLPKVKSDDIIICMHSWVMTVEATDPAEFEGEQPTLRRRTEDACDDGLVEAYSTELQDAAVPLLAPCARLDPPQHRNSALLLAACGMLRGDRLAAAAVMNRASGFRRVDGPESANLLKPLFDYRAKVDWNGERNRDDGSAAAFWAGKVVDGDASFFLGTLEGETASRVRVAATLERRVEGTVDGEHPIERASVEQIWMLNQGGDFVVESAKVGPFERVRER
jgi:hypothetical protein